MSARHRGTLSGKSVVVTRSADKAADIRAALEALGARVTVLPTTRHVPCAEARAFLQSVTNTSMYTDIVFTSQTAVKFFLEISGSTRPAGPPWSALRAAAVGPATAAALRRSGWEPALTSVGGASELAQAILDRGPPGRVLLPQSSIARPELREALERAGVQVDAVAVYDTVPEDPSRLRSTLEEAFAASDPDAVLFASPSAFAAFLEVVGEPHRSSIRTGTARIVSIGGTTSAAVRQAGYEVAAEALSPTVEGMVEATARALEGRAEQ